MRFAAAGCLLLLSLSVGASSQQDPQSQPKKAPKVYTNEDLEGLTGGVNVVGDPAKPDKPAPKDAAKPGATAPAAKSKMPPQKDQCADWAWGAVVAASLSNKGVPFDAAYWVDKTWGTGRCLNALPPASGLVASIDGDYTLDDGVKVRIQSVVGAPSGGGIVDSLQRKRPVIVLWKGIPYMASGVRGVQMDNGDGSFTYYIREMTLSNPYLGKNVTFNSEKDKESELEAVIFKVLPRQ